MPSYGLFRASGSDGICCRRKRRRSYWTSEDSSCRSRYPDMGQDQRGERIKSSRPVCQAAKAIAQTAASVRATRGSNADHLKTSGRRGRKKTTTRSKKRPLLMRLASSAAVQVGAPYSRGKSCQRPPVVSISSERFFDRVLVFFRPRRPLVFRWSAFDPRVARTDAAVWAIALAAWQTGRLDLIRSPLWSWPMSGYRERQGLCSYRP